MNFETRGISCKQWAQKHRTVILLADELLGRMIYWVPIGTNDNSSCFREVAWGLLQLHRLLFDVLTAEDSPQQSYGTSVSIEPSIPANEIRLALSILQSLWPIVHELARKGDDSTQRQANVLVWIERIRFVLRLTLLGSYWARLSSSGCVHSGILLNGGIFHNINGYSADEERRRAERGTYFGKRCGRPLEQRIMQNQSPDRSLLPTRYKQLVFQLCELAYISRPLLSAEAGRKGYKWNIFFATFLWDLASIGLLEKTIPKGNILTENELKRRKFRILLYLLREPCWGSSTQPLMERFDSTLKDFPFAGNLMRNYLWEYLLYAKLYLVEE